MRIFTMSKRVIDRLVGQDVHDLFQVELLRIELRQCRRQFDSQFRGIQNFPSGQNYIDSMAELPSEVARRRGEAHRNKAYAGDLTRIQKLGQFVAIYPRRAEQLERRVRTSAHRNICAFDQPHSRIERCLDQAAQIGRWVCPF